MTNPAWETPVPTAVFYYGIFLVARLAAALFILPARFYARLREALGLIRGVIHSMPFIPGPSLFILGNEQLLRASILTYLQKQFSPALLKSTMINISVMVGAKLPLKLFFLWIVVAALWKEIQVTVTSVCIW